MLKVKNVQDIRYYLYVSDQKVNMLFEQMFAEQVRKKRGKLAVEFRRRIVASTTQLHWAGSTGICENNSRHNFAPEFQVTAQFRQLPTDLRA